jgi:hypothetical protein
MVVLARVRMDALNHPEMYSSICWTSEVGITKALPIKVFLVYFSIAMFWTALLAPLSNVTIKQIVWL